MSRDILVQESDDPSPKSIQTRRVDLAFPYHHHPPAAPPQLPPSSLVSFRVTAQLGRPIVDSRRGNAAPTATVQVPEAAVDIDDLVEAGEYEVGGPRERADMQTITVAQGMHETADQQFRRRVLRLDRRHDVGPLGFREGVHDANPTSSRCGCPACRLG